MTVPDPVRFRRRLLRWYDASKRDLPWRRAGSAWEILVSEIMLQQTRVEAVIRYYRRFLERFPDPAAMARASEQEVLAAWGGLGYYSRARNLWKAAAAAENGFPGGMEGIRALPGVGPYTAAAVGSIAFHLPFAAVDGNVLRVIARLTADGGDVLSPATRTRFTQAAQELLAPSRPGDFNQAMMELGATVCVARRPLCLLCPVAADCRARNEGTQDQFPVRRARGSPGQAAIEVVAVRRPSGILLRQRGEAERRMPGFWELPVLSDVPMAREVKPAATFRHTIVNTVFTVTVFTALVKRAPKPMRWFAEEALEEIPLTTITRKALRSIS